jgi:peptide/nickel transport system substrate-binding protein
MTLPGRLIALVVIAAGGAAVFACNKQAAQPQAAATLRIGVGVPPQGSADIGVRALVDLLTTEAIVTNELDGRNGERIATRWSWNDDRTVLRLSLRSDIFFHDGTPLTPELAAQALTTSIKRGQSFSFSSVTSVAASGPDTVDITLKEPNSFLLSDLSLTSLRMPKRPEIGTGPFRLVQSGDHSVLQAFEKYHKGRPTLDTVAVDLYPTQRKAWTAMLRGELAVLYDVSGDAAEFVERETRLRTYTFPRAYYVPFVFNVRHPVLRNKEVRRAINEALNRTALIADGMRGRGTAADGPIWPGHWAYTESAERFAYNPEAARARLEKAGFPIKPASGGRMPSRFSFTCLLLGDSRFERLAIVLQKQLAEVGIDLRLTPVTADEMGVRASKGDFDSFLYEMAGRSLSWVYTFWHSPGDVSLIDTGYRAGDAMLDRIRRAPSEDEIRRGVADLMRVFHDDPPAAFIAWQVTSRAVSVGYDVMAEPDRDIFFNVWKWRPAAAGQQASR